MSGAGGAAVEVRAARGDDDAAIRGVHEAAFERSLEADLVEALQRRARPIVSLVATGAASPSSVGTPGPEPVVGQILFSPVTLDRHPELSLLGLAPMAVLPRYQRRGVGSALVRAGLERCRASGCDAVVVLGHPEYYPRFGFIRASRVGIGCEYDAPDEAFLVLELCPGSLADVAGTARYHSIFAEL